MKRITVAFTELLYHMYGGRFADGWLGQGCWYLWLSAYGKFSRPEGGLIILLFAPQWRVLVYIGSMKTGVVI